jgi:histidinol-phosphate aminotransferase
MMIKPKKLISKIWRPELDSSERKDFYRFERNERTTLFTDEQYSDILSNLTSYDLVAYGELEPFYKKICDWLNVDRKNILLTSGSDAGIRAVYEAFVSEGDEVLISLPNYAMYSVYTAMYGGKEVQHFYDKDLTLDVEKFLQKINTNTTLVVVSNPGHTGTVIKENEMVRILERAELYNSLVIIDEAYHHFYPETMIEYIHKFENLVLSRTFSKAFGLASLRIGLLIGCDKIIDELYKVKLVHEITGISAKIGLYMLDHMELVDQYIDDVNKGKSILYDRLIINGFEIVNSEANFIFLRTPDGLNSLELKQYLEKNKILIRGPFERYPFDNHLRITVGDEEQMNLFCDILADYSLIHNRKSLDDK